MKTIAATATEIGMAIKGELELTVERPNRFIGIQIEYAAKIAKITCRIGSMISQGIMRQGLFFNKLS